MKKLLLLMAAGAFWLCGYYVAQRPGSPDLYTWANARVADFEAAGGREKVDQAIETARVKVRDMLDAKAEAPSAEEPAPLTARIESARKLKIPQCW